MVVEVAMGAVLMCATQASPTAGRNVKLAVGQTPWWVSFPCWQLVRCLIRIRGTSCGDYSTSKFGNDVCFLHSFFHFSAYLWSLTLCAAQRTCDLAGLVLLKGSAKGHIHVHLYTGQEGGIDIFSSDSFMGQ